MTRCIQCKQTPDESEWVGKTVGIYTIEKFLGFYGTPTSGWWLGRDFKGRTRELKTAFLSNGTSTHIYYMDNYEAAVRKTYSKYKDSARSRGYPFDLTFEEFITLIEQDCAYCGSPPSNTMTANNDSREKFKYNGIDRKYNKDGYCLPNCVTCCIICNRGKSSLSYAEWLVHIERLVSHNVEASEEG